MTHIINHNTKNFAIQIIIIQFSRTLLMPNEKRIVQVSVVNTPNLQNGIGTVTLLVTGAYKTTARSAMVYFTQSVRNHHVQKALNITSIQLLITSLQI